MTLYFENTILATLPACLAIITFIYRAISLHRCGQPHGLARTNLTFWPSQVLMLAAASVLIVRAGLIGKEPDYSPSSIIASASMGISWVSDDCQKGSDDSRPLPEILTIFIGASRGVKYI